mgnify:CR=1 FL=1
MNFRILINYVRDDIAEKLFRNNVKMVENKIQFFYIEFNCTWVQIHSHVSSSKMRNMLSNDDGWHDCFKKYAHGGLQHAESQFATKNQYYDHR